MLGFYRWEVLCPIFKGGGVLCWVSKGGGNVCWVGDSLLDF